VLFVVLQMFYVGPNYLEVDLDVHNYAFLARKALWGYHDRIPTVVWDNGFVIQVRLLALGCGMLTSSRHLHLLLFIVCSVCLLCLYSLYDLWHLFVCMHVSSAAGQCF
jgi:hypothetical protein